MQPSKRQIQKENTRQKIMETAYRVYAEKGFMATTSEIAQEAGIAHGSIFAHFATLNDLLVSLVENFGDAIGTRLHSLSEKSTDIEELTKAHLDILEEYENFYTKFITEMPLLPAEAKNTFAAIQSVVAFHFSKVIEQGIEKGRFKKIPPHLLFNTWLGFVHYYLQNKEFFAPDGSVLGRYKAELRATFSELIK